MSITFNVDEEKKDEKNNLEFSETSKLFNKEKKDIYFDDYFVSPEQDKIYVDSKNIDRTNEVSFDSYLKEDEEPTKLRRFNYGRKQEQTVLGNLYQMGKAAITQDVSGGETWSKALQRVEKQRQVEIFKEYDDMQGREEDGYVLTGRLHDAILDPAYLLIPWSRIAQANRLASVGLSAAVGGVDAMARDYVLYGHVDKTNVAISASLAGVGGAVGDAVAQFFKPTRKLNSIGEDTGEGFSTYGLDRQQLLDLGDELIMENTPTVQRIVRSENKVTDLSIKRKALIREKEELLKDFKSIKPDDPDNKKFGEQLDFFGFDNKKQFPNIKAIENVNKQLKNVNKELNDLRFNQMKDRGIIGIASFLQASTKGFLKNETWDIKGKALSKALLHETVRPLAYGMSGGVMGLYLADDSNYNNDDEKMKRFALFAAGAGFLHKRILNYNGKNLSPTIKTKILNLITDEVKQEYSFSFRGFMAKHLASSQSAKLAAGSPPLQKFGLKTVRTLGTKLSSDEVIYESIDEMRDVISNRFKYRLTRIFSEIDKETRFTVGRLLQNKNMKPNSKYTFLKEGDLENEKARLAYQRYIVLENEFKDYIKDTGLIYRQDNSYGLTQLFAEGSLDDKQLLEMLSKAFKIQYRNNKDKYEDIKDINKWANKQAQSYLDGADPLRRESIITEKSLLDLSNSISSPIISRQNNSKSSTLIQSSRFLDNERILFDQEARAFAKDIFVQDPFYTTTVLYDSVIPIAEFSKVFGPNGERLKFVRDEIKKHYQELLPKGQILRKGNTAYNTYKDELKEVANTINSYFKVYGDNFNGHESIRSIIYALQTMTSVKGLSKVAIPNLGDIMQTIQNSGYRSSWESALRQLKENSLTKGINMVKPSSNLSAIDRYDRPHVLRFWKNAKYGKKGTMESILQDTTQNINSKNTFQQNLHLFQQSFFELNQLGRVTRLARDFAYDAGAFQGYNLSRKLVQTGKLSRSETRELSYLGIEKEIAKIIGQYKNMDDAWNNNTVNKFIEKAGQRSADRDAMLPQVGNRLLFSQTNNPFVKAAGTFLSWAQAKASQTNALLTRIEDGDVKLALRVASLLPVYFGVRQLALAASSSRAYKERESVEMYYTDEGFIDIFEAEDFKSFTKEMGDSIRFSGQLVPWWMDKIITEYGRPNMRQGELSGIIPVASTVKDLALTVPYLGYSIPGAALDLLGVDLFGIHLSDKFWQQFTETMEFIPYVKDVTRANKGDSLLGIPTDMFVDDTIDASLYEQAKNKDLERRRSQFKGGLQVANAVDNPKDRINPYTGQPYAVTAGVSLLDILERRNLLNTTPRMPFGVGSLVSSLLKPKQNDFLVGQIDKAVSKFDDMLKEKNWSVGDVKANTKFKLKTDEVVEEGQLIDARRNLNSRSKDKTSKVMEHPIEAARPKINTIHKSGGKNRFGQGKAATYDTAVVTQGNNELGVDQVLRHEIATEAISKTPMAAVRGKYTSKILTPEDLKANDLKEILKRASTVFGFNPKMFNTFVDFESGLAIKSFNGIAVTLDTQVFAILKNPTKFKDVVIDDKMVRLYDDIEYYTPETIPKYQDAFNSLSKTQQQTHTKTLQNAKVALDDAGLFRTGKTVPTDILNKFKDSLFKEGDLKTPFKKVTPENYNSLFGGFQTDATLLAYPKYAALKGKKINIVDMTPDEYIKESAKLFNISPKILEKNRIENTAGFGGQELIDKLKNSMKQIMEGKKLKLGNDEYDSFAPVALYANKQQEGLHRAIAAKQLGIKKIPVIVEKNIKRVDQGAGYNYFKEADRVEYNKGNLVNRLQQRNMYG